MPQYSHPIFIVSQELEGGLFLAEALLYPEVSRLGTDLSPLASDLRKAAEEIAGSQAELWLHQRSLVTAPSVEEIQVSLEPPRGSPDWSRPMSLTFHLVRWRHAEDTEIAFIPALGIEVVGHKSDEFLDLVRKHIQFALIRRDAARLGEEMLHAARAGKVHVTEALLDARLPTLKEKAREKAREEEKESALERTATRLWPSRMPRAYEVGETVRRLAEHLTSRPPRSVLVHGKPGVGKTAAILELSRSRSEHGLSEVEFFQTSGARLAAGQCGYGMWQERCVKLCRDASKRRAVLVLGHLVELMGVGKSAGSSQGIASFLRPYIQRGEILAIAECTTDQLPLIEREDPQLLRAFEHVPMEEPEPYVAQMIIFEASQEQARGRGITVTEDGLARLDLLHRRYATYSAYPGRPLRFLKNLIRDASRGSTVTSEVVTKAFARETGLPLFLLEDSLPMDLEETRRWFSRRVIGQEEAVRQVVGILARVKARMTRQGKPIASFLFIGPTGVGKTEMAKVLAEHLFSSRDRMVRIDMSEYADPSASVRLAGGSFGSEGILTSRVRESPFSVVLLDEFEKAHPSCYDLLLQVLGEGRLTDAGGRVADFSNSIVIMTSNLGVETYRQGGPGFPGAAGGLRLAREHFTEEVRAFLKPELFNRIDGIVCFLPLEEESILEIARRELDEIRKRDGIHLTDVKLEVPDAVIRHLARRGFDPVFGARPLKRTIERELLVQLSEALNSPPGKTSGLSKALDFRRPFHMSGRTVPWQVEVEMADGRPSAAMRPREDLPEGREEGPETVRECMQLRRDLHHVKGMPAILELENEVYMINRSPERLIGRALTAEEVEEQAHLKDLLRFQDRFAEIFEETSRLEEELLVSFFARNPTGGSPAQALLRERKEAWRNWLVEFYGFRRGGKDKVTLAVYGEDAASTLFLVKGYHEAVGPDAVIAMVRFVMESESGGKQEAGAGKGHLVSLPILNRAAFLDGPSAPAIGIALRISEPLAAPRFEPEAGLHVLVRGKKEARCLVDVTPAPLEGYAPPPGVERKGALDGIRKKRRTYDLEQKRAGDPELGRGFAWTGGDFSSAIRALVERRLVRDAKAFVGL